MKCRKLFLLTPLLLAGCITESASYIIDGNEHALTVRVDQNYFWKDEVTVKLIAARLPECQRQFVLGNLAESQLEIGLFSSGENVFTLRAAGQLWRVETQSCKLLTAPADNALGERIGTFRLDAEKKMVFEAAGTATRSATPSATSSATPAVTSAEALAPAPAATPAATLAAT